jgi:hypothetical protein
MNKSQYKALRKGLRKAKFDDAAVTRRENQKFDPYRNGRVSFHEYERAFCAQHRLGLKELAVLLAKPAPAEAFRLPRGPRANEMVSRFPRYGQYAGLTLNKRVAFRGALKQIQEVFGGK